MTQSLIAIIKNINLETFYDWKCSLNALSGIERLKQGTFIFVSTLANLMPYNKFNFSEFF